MSRTPRLKRCSALVAIAAVGIVVHRHAAGACSLALHLGPAAICFAVLAAGRYPGQRLLVIEQSPSKPRRVAVAQTTRRRQREITLPRGGRLLASALAGRAPPLRSASDLSLGSGAIVA